MRFVGKNVSVEDLDDTGVDYGNNPPPTVVVVDTRGIDNGVTPTVTELTESHDLFREVQKDVKEAIATHSDFVALEHLYFTMENIYLDKGKFNPVEASLTLDSIHRINKRYGLKDQTSSLEAFKDEIDAIDASKVSMEEVYRKVYMLFERVAQLIGRAVYNAVGFFKSFTPTLSKRKEEALSLLNRVKIGADVKSSGTVSGDWVNKLMIDGAVPEPKEVIQTCEKIIGINHNVLTAEGDNIYFHALRQALIDMTKDIEAKDVKRPSLWWYVAIAIVAVLDKNGNATAAMQGGQEIAAMMAAAKSLDLNGKVLPSMRKIYPSITNNSVAGLDDLSRIRYYSDPLFNNGQFKASDLDINARIRNREQIVTKLTNKIQGHDLGIEFESGGGSKRALNITALSKNEQIAVLERVLQMLDDCIQYYKNYGERAEKRYQMWKIALKNASDVFEGKHLFLNPQAGLAHSSLINVCYMISDLYWNGIFHTQTKYIKYLGTTAVALTDYVRASNRFS